VLLYTSIIISRIPLAVAIDFTLFFLFVFIAKDQHLSRDFILILLRFQFSQTLFSFLANGDDKKHLEKKITSTFKLKIAGCSALQPQIKR